MGGTESKTPAGIIIYGTQEKAVDTGLLASEQSRIYSLL